MTIQEWLSGLEYKKNPSGAIFNSQDVCVLDITGFGVFSRIFPSTEKSLEFLDSVGQFVLEAINEKLENDKEKDRIWKVIQAMLPPIDEETRIKIEKQLSKEPYGNTNN